MLLSLIKYVQGYVHVELTGYAPERFLNLCGNHDILIWNLTPCGEGYAFCISVKGFRKLKPILKKTRTHIRIKKRVGTPFATFRYRKRKLFGIGLIVFGALLYYLSEFIWNIEINGNSYLSNEVILDFLAEEESSFGAKKDDINCAALEEALRTRYDEVIWTSIKIYGTKLTVDIQENLLPKEQYEKEEDAVYDIVAAKDGTVSDIITRSGTPLVSAGTKVTQGEVLVTGRIAITNDNGEVGEYLYRSADADVTARVVYEYEDVLERDYVKRVPTGEETVNYTVFLGSFSVTNPFFRDPYEKFQITSDTTQLHVAGNFYLPIWLVRERYTEIEESEESHSEAEIRQIATKNLNNYLKDLEENGIQIIAKNVIIKRTGENYVACGSIEVYESIVSYQPTTIVDITSEESWNTDESD